LLSWFCPCQEDSLSSSIRPAFDWSSPFSGEWYLRFRAGPEDIEKFLAASRSLERRECQRFSPERMLLPSPGNSEEPGRHEYYVPDSMAPPGYRPELRGRGGRYMYHKGEVIIDDETHLVYVKVIWS
jgi:hypothetical protein